MTETTTIPSRIAACADTDGDGHTIHGVAIRGGEVTRGLNGRKKWPADVLRASAETLEGTPVNLLHSEQQIGEVTRAAYSDAQEAVVYQADITDPKVYEQVRSGHLEPSIESTHGRGGTDATGAMLVSNNRFTGLSLLQHGASQAGSTDTGPAPEQAFAARLSVGQIKSALAEHTASPTSPRTFHIEAPDSGEMDFQSDTLGWGIEFPNSGVYVDWNIDAWPDDSKLDGAHVSQYATVEDANKVAQGEIVFDEEAAAATSALRSLLAEHGEMDTRVPDEYVFDNPGEAVRKAQEMGFDGAGGDIIHTHGSGDGTVFMPGPSHDDLLEALDDDTQAQTAAHLLNPETPYEVTNVAPDDVDKWTDAEWDGDAAIADAPNPSETDDAPETLDRMMALVPADDAARDAKVNWGGPFRATPGGGVNTRALVAIDGALSGARNGFSSLSAETRESASQWVQSMLAAAPDDLFGADTEAEAADALNEGAWVSFRADGEEHIGRVAYSDEERSLVKRYDEEAAELTDESIAKATAHIHATDAPEGAAAAHHLEADAAADIDAGDIVTWNSQGDRPAAGRVIETIDEGRYDTELSGDAAVNAPAALIRLHRPRGDGEWSSTQTTVAHRTDTDTLTVHDDWPDLARMQVARLVDINGIEIDLTPPEYVVAAAEAALDAKGRYDSLADCGTGVGESRAETIINNDLAPADFTGGENTAIPDYLNSHSEDVAGIDTHPREWDEETWTDGCGPVQYALWGGTGDGRGLEWAQDLEAELQAAMDAAEDEAEAGAEAQPSDERAESRVGPSGDTTPQSEQPMTDDPDNPDPEDATELKARLSDKNDRIDELEAELAEVREERDEYEEQATAVDEAEEAFAAALADHVPRDAEALQSDLSLSQMRAWLADIDDASVGDATPTNTDPDPDVQTGGGDGQTAQLSAAEQERKDEIEARLAELDEKDHALAEKESDRLEAELAELTEA